MRYFEWLSEVAISDQLQREMYQKLLQALYSKNFYWSVANDGNRADDGTQLRVMYERDTGLRCEKVGPCSVLEMMVALAIDCENYLMYDPDEGDRTSVWFWEMIQNLQLDSLDDWCFDREKFDLIIRRFLDRRYSKDGYGGPFYIENFGCDMRKIELWYQVNYYLKNKYLW